MCECVVCLLARQSERQCEKKERGGGAERVKNGKGETMTNVYDEHAVSQMRTTPNSATAKQQQS